MKEISIEDQRQIELNKRKLNAIFLEWDINAKCVETVFGSRVTLYIITGDIKKVRNFIYQLSLFFSERDREKIRINDDFKYSKPLEYVCIEIPNENYIPLYEGFDSLLTKLRNKDKHPLELPIGFDLDNKLVSCDLDYMPHMLIGGSQIGNGKNIYLNVLISTLISRNSPSQLKLALADSTPLGFVDYKDIPHLIFPLISSHEETEKMLDSLIKEMDNRYSVFLEKSYKSIAFYNNQETEKLPYIVAVINDYNLLVEQNKKIMEKVLILAQKSRAAGIHLVVCGSFVNVNVLSGALKLCLATKISFAASSQLESVLILGEAGAERLLGKGDMLISSPLIKKDGAVRLQCPFISNDEIKRVVFECTK